MECFDLTEKIIGCALTVHKSLGCGFLESVYQKALAHELVKAGLCVECERPVTVFYDGVNVGDFFADMLVEGKVIVENKSVQKISTIHEVQLVNYLTATGIDVGLLLNFGATSLEIKRKLRVLHPKVSKLRMNSGNMAEPLPAESFSGDPCPPCGRAAFPDSRGFAKFAG